MKKLFPLLLILAFLASSCKKEGATVYNVSYTIGCTDCEVIYVSDQAGTQSTEYHKNSSWTYSFAGTKNQQLLLLAYNTASAPQGVTATISMNNAVLSTQTTYCPVNGTAFCVDTIQ
jgi:hypothetical protein